MAVCAAVATTASARADELVRLGGANPCRPGSHWLAGTHAGYNYLVKGYTGYTNLWIAGVDLLYYAISETRDDRRNSVCKDSLMARFSFEYAPLKVPDGNYGLSEDNIFIDMSILYRIGPPPSGTLAQWVPFVGGGLGVAIARTSLTTPATGSVSGSSGQFALSASLGIYSPEVFSSLHLTPELRMHGALVPQGIAYNLAIQIGLTYWPSDDIREHGKISRPKSERPREVNPGERW
ncbi:MAG TPA: hypothetical protein VM598_08060 [Bdellovibrionota bacterium]|nr:hypothetical protein [Bdellovibrionota bacterium]